MSDAVIKERTGCTWERWVKALDHKGADKMSHREIALLVSEKYKVPSWWTQTVTVGYERIKGLRARGQRPRWLVRSNQVAHVQRSGTTLFTAWKDANIRKRWLDEAGVKVRTATAPEVDAARLERRHHHRRRLLYPKGRIKELSCRAAHPKSA
jgi:hypothetical protein